MSAGWFKRKDNVNQFQTLVVKATTAASQNDDWGTILEVAENIADIIQAHNGAKEALKCLKPSVTSKSARVCLAGIMIIEVCVRNCDSRFHRELATKKWMNRFLKIVKTTMEPAVRMAIVQLLVDWKTQFREDPTLDAFDKACQELEGKGMTLPPPSNFADIDFADDMNQLATPRAMQRQADQIGAPSIQDMPVERMEERIQVEERVQFELNVVSEDMASLQACLEMDPDDMPDDAFQVARDCQGWQDRLKNLVAGSFTTPRPGQPAPEKIPNALLEQIFTIHDSLDDLLREWRDKASDVADFKKQQKLANAKAGAPPAPAGGVKSDNEVNREGTNFQMYTPRGTLNSQSTNTYSGGVEVGPDANGEIPKPPATAYSGAGAAEAAQREEEMKEDIAYLKEMLQHAETAIDMLEEELGASLKIAERWREQFAESNKTNEDLKLQLSSAQTTMAQNPETPRDKRAAFESLEKELVEAYDWKEKYLEENRLQMEKSDKVAELEAKMEAVEGDGTAASEQLEECNRRLREVTEERDALAGQVDAQDEQLTSLSSDKAELVKTLAEAQAGGEAGKAETESLATQLANIGLEKDNLEKENGRLEAEVGAAMDASSDANNQIQELQEEVRVVKSNTASNEKELADTKALYAKEARMRKKLHNKVQELQGNLRVYARVRPLSSKEIGQNTTDITSIPEDQVLIINDANAKINQLKTFEFDCCFGPKSTQEEVFKDTEPLMISVLDGFNVCIFAYGQTGSGKTFTMEGSPEMPGLSYRSVARLFEVIGENDNMEAEIYVSMLEIYNDTIIDLLAEGDTSGCKYDIRVDPVAGVYINDLSRIQVHTASHVGNVIAMGNKNRSVTCTAMNAQSSRSHMMVQILCRTTDSLTGGTTVGKLTLCDLAGSERIGKSEVQGQALKEAQAINKSLSCLGDVIAALGAKQGHVPYRNSKLTHVLQDSLGGNSKTLMFVNCSPAAVNCSESVCSLQFASRAKSVELGKACKNVEKAATKFKSAVGK